MSYRLIKSQIGGSNCEILILIAAIVVVWFLFVQSNTPKKEKFDLTESYTPINAQLKSSSPSSTASEQENIYDRPAVDILAPGVPYLDPPRHFNPQESAENTRSKKSKKSKKSKRSKNSGRRLTPSETKSTISISMSTKSNASKNSKVASSEVSVASNGSKVGSPPYVSPMSTSSEPGYGSSEKSPMSPGLSVASSPNSTPVMTVISESEKRNKSKKSNKVIEKYTDVNKLYSVKDSYDLKTPLTKSTCSQKCCGYYWKENMDGLFKKDDPVKWNDVGVGKKFRSSNVTCMGDGVSPPGCRCHTVDQYEVLATRGGNGSRKY